MLPFQPTHHNPPVSAGPPRRGQTVCGGISGGSVCGGSSGGSSSNVEVDEELRQHKEIMKERPLSVNTLHLLASATLKRAGRQFEYVRKEVVDNSASAGPPRRGQTVCGGSSLGGIREDWASGNP